MLFEDFARKKILMKLFRFAMIALMLGAFVVPAQAGTWLGLDLVDGASVEFGDSLEFKLINFESVFDVDDNSEKVGATKIGDELKGLFFVTGIFKNNGVNPIWTPTNSGQELTGYFEGATANKVVDASGDFGFEGGILKACFGRYWRKQALLVFWFSLYLLPPKP